MNVAALAARHSVEPNMTTKQNKSGAQSDTDASTKLAAQAEAESKRLRELIASVPGVVWEAWGAPDDSAQRINFVSDYVEHMLGYTVEEWLATPNFWLRIVHPEDRERAAHETRKKFEDGRGGTTEFRWITKDGRVGPVEAPSGVLL